jgi:hypothetical protein
MTRGTISFSDGTIASDAARLCASAMPRKPTQIQGFYAAQ